MLLPLDAGDDAATITEPPVALMEEQILASWVVNAGVWTRAVRRGEILSRVRVTNGAVLQAIADCAPATLLDLGCGDAIHLANIAMVLPISRYDGVDLSPVALQLAEQNLQGLNCPVNLHTGDMLSFLESDESKYDVIFTSYAFHHLNKPEMMRFLGAAFHHLRPGGQLALVDVIRQQGQSLADYLDAFCEDMRRQWLNLSPEELDHAIRHVRDCDQPPALEELREIALQAGLDDFRAIYRKDWYQLITFGSRAL